MSSIVPSAEQFQQFLADYPDGEPVVMLNLLRFREQADYPADFDAEPCSGAEAYGRYGTAVVERVASVGGRLVWTGAAHPTVIGPTDEAWDLVALIEYPSKQAFADMLAQPEYQAVAPHRTASLADSRLVPMRAAPDAFSG